MDVETVGEGGDGVGDGGGLEAELVAGVGVVEFRVI